MLCETTKSWSEINLYGSLARWISSSQWSQIYHYRKLYWHDKTHNLSKTQDHYLNWYMITHPPTNLKYTGQTISPHFISPCRFYKMNALAFVGGLEVGAQVLAQPGLQESPGAAQWRRSSSRHWSRNSPAACEDPTAEQRRNGSKKEQRNSYEMTITPHFPSLPTNTHGSG